MKRAALASLLISIAASGAHAADGERSAVAGEPLTVAIVLDTSGSVGKEFETTRALLVGLLEHLPAGSEAALFTFDDQARLLLPWTHAPEDLRRALAIVRPTGRFTALHDALYDASRTLRDAPAHRKALVLLTDGKDEGSTLALEDGLRIAEDGHLPVFAVGVGHVQDKILRRIAKLTDGDYIPLAKAAPGPLAAALAAAQPVVAPAANADSAPATPESAEGAPAPALRSRLRIPSRFALILGVAVPVLLVGVVMSVLMLRRRRARPQCAACGFELESALARCTNCKASANVRIAEAVSSARVGRIELSSGSRRAEPVRAEIRRQREQAWPRAVGGGDPAPLSETVLARLNNTEEYLEKTITLREKPVLMVVAGPGSGHVYALSDQTTTCLGRAKMNDIVLEDISVSSEHCRIRPEDGGFVVHDLKSTNGTYVNEKRVTHHPLAAGDSLKVGETVLQYKLDHQRTD